MILEFVFISSRAVQCNYEEGNGVGIFEESRRAKL
jgi:hypothetical protein